MQSLKAISIRRAATRSVVLLLCLVATAACLISLTKRPLDRYLRQSLVEYLEENFEVSVQLQHLDFKLLGSSAVLRGLQIARSGSHQGPPLIDVSRLHVDFRLLDAMVGKRVRFQQVELDQAGIRLTRTGEQEWDLLEIFKWRNDDDGSGDPPSGPTLEIDSVVVRNGWLDVDGQTFEIHSARGGISLQTRLDRETLHHSCRLLLSRTELSNSWLSLGPFDADLRFSLGDGILSLHSSSLASQGVQIRAGGSVRLGGPLKYALRLSGEVETASGLLPEGVEGRLRSDGDLSGSGDSFLFRGTATSDTLEVAGLDLRDIQATLQLDPAGAEIEDLRARLGQALLRGSSHVALDTGRSTFSLSATALELKTFVHLLPPSHPIREASLDFRATGGWPGLDTGGLQAEILADFEGSLESPFAHLPEPIRVRGDSRTSLQASVLSILELEVRSPHGHARGSGSVELRDGGPINLAILFETADPDPIQAGLLQAASLPEPVGAGSIRGQLRVRGGGGPPVEATGRFEMEALSYGGLPVGRLEGNLTWSDGLMTLQRLALEGPQGSLAGTLRAARSQGEFQLQGMDVSVQDVSLPWIADVLDRDWDLQGDLSGTLRSEMWAGGGSLRSSAVTAWGVPVRDLKADFDFDQSELRVHALQGQVGDGSLQGSLQVGPDSLQGQLDGRNLSASQLPESWATGLLGESHVAFKASIQGTPGAPNVEIQGHLDRLQILGDSPAPIAFRVHNREGRFEQLDFELSGTGLGTPVTATGQLDLTRPYALSAGMDLKGLAIPKLIESLAPGRFSGVEGAVDARLDLRGPAGDPKHLTLESTLNLRDVSVSGYGLDNPRPIRLTMRDQVLHVDLFELQGESGHFSLQGEVGLAGRRSLLLEGGGDLNLILLTPFYPEAAASGNLRVTQLVISGTLLEPELVGEASLQDGFFRHPSIPVSLFQAEGALKFTRQQVSIDRMSANTAYGRLSGSGGLFLDGLAPTRWAVNLYGDGLRLEYPEGVHSALDIDIDYIGTGHNRLLSGAAYIRSARYDETVSIPELMVRLSQIRPVSSPLPGPAIDLDLTLEGYRSVEIQNNLADVTGTVDLQVRGTFSQPVLLGSLTVDEGSLFLEGNEYDLRRGAVTFSNPRSTRPVFNLEAATEVRGYDVTAIVNGPAEQLGFAFRSDPPLPTSSIVSLLALGRVPDAGVTASGPASGYTAFYGAGSILSRMLSDELSRQTSRLLGFDRFTIDPFATDTGRNPATRVTLGKAIGKHLSVTYSTDLGSTQLGQGVIIQLDLTDWLSAIGSREPTGELAVDFKLKKRF